MKRWLRSMTLRARLAWTLVGVSLLSVFALGAVNYVQSRELLDSGVEDQLEAVTEGRSAAIEGGLERASAQIAALARDGGVVAALEDLDRGFQLAQRRERLTPEQEAELRTAYEEGLFDLFAEADVEPPPVDDLLPTTDAGRYLQYQYIVENPFPADERRRLDEAEDGSAYSAAHGTHHPFLRSLAESLGLGDLLLVSAGTDQIVHTVDKRVDFATDLASGPYADTALAETALTRLSEAGVGETVFVDFQPYLPAGGSPVLFLASAVRSDREVIGALVAEIPAEALTTITTASGEFDELGLGETGEAYVVGGDRLMRTDPRRFIEDPEGYVERFRDEGYPEDSAPLIEFAGSTAFLQPVDNEAVETALDGESFTGVTTSYLGDEVLASAVPLGVEELDWVVVAEIETSETDNALNEYLERILLIAAVLTPVVAIVAFLVARSLTRSLPPLVEAAADVADGDLDVVVPDLGRNEVGEVARRLNDVTSRLRDQGRALQDEEGEINRLLASVLPPRLVEQVRSGRRELGDVIDTATVVALSVHLRSGVPADDPDAAGFTTRAAGVVEEAAAGHGLERVRSSSEEHLYVGGLRREGYEADAGVRFAREAMGAVRTLAEEADQEVELRAGVASGEVAAGVLGEDRLAFGVWGDPPGRALTLDSTAEPGQVLLDQSAVDRLEDAWPLGDRRTLTGLGGETIRAVVLGDRD